MVWGLRTENARTGLYGFKSQQWPFLCLNSVSVSSTLFFYHKIRKGGNWGVTDFYQWGAAGCALNLLFLLGYEASTHLSRHCACVHIPIWDQSFGVGQEANTNAAVCHLLTAASACSFLWSHLWGWLSLAFGTVAYRVSELVSWGHQPERASKFSGLVSQASSTQGRESCVTWLVRSKRSLPGSLSS